MMFLLAVPVMQAFGLYLVPLMIGTRQVAFPRLNAFGYWIYLFGGLFIWVAFLLNVGVDTGWFSYAPLSGPGYSPGKRVDIWAQMITFTELAALVAAVEIIVTALKFRAPGMSLDLSMVATAFLGFGLWVHHMFAVGLPQLGHSFFTAASLIIAIPTGTQVFCWIATLARGRVVIRTPLLYVLGFVAVFVLGGLTG